MTFTTGPADADVHAWAVRTMPWLINGTLQASDRVRLEAHLAGCEACRARLLEERRIARAMTVAPVVDYAPNASFSRLMARIDAEPESWRSRLRRTLGARFASSGAPAWPRGPYVAAIALQSAVIAVLAIALVRVVERPPSGPAAGEAYATLSATPSVSAAHLAIVFIPQATIADMRAALEAIGGRIVDGPGGAGVFHVALDGSLDPAAAAVRLRAIPAVRLVQVDVPAPAGATP